MKLFDIIKQEYELQRQQAKQRLCLQNEDTQLGSIFRALQSTGKLSPEGDNQYIYDEYTEAINQRRFSTLSAGITYFEKYENYEVVSYECTRRIVHPADRNNDDVVEIVLTDGSDTITLWWLPKRNRLTYNHDEKENSND